jgi:glycosyltransferase involved in cell wall biosynthesis
MSTAPRPSAAALPAPSSVNGRPLRVSVVLLTYNHEKYLAQALDGILMQQTDFDFEIIVTEDCSTDGTRAILAGYRDRHPDRIRLLLSPSNLCTNEVFTRAVDAARGEYIATLDGDDFWTSPHKLQRQVEFLDTHPACSMVFHNAMVVHEDASRAPWRIGPDDLPALLTLDDLWGAGFIAFCSVLVRRTVLMNRPRWFMEAEVGDWAVFLLAGQHGNVGYISEVMATYRRHAAGLWWQLPHHVKLHRLIAFYRKLDRDLGRTYEHQIGRLIAASGEELRREVGSHAKRRAWAATLHAASLYVRNFPREIVGEVITEFWPSYKPRPYRRRPVLQRMVGRLHRLSGHAERQATGFEGYVDQLNDSIVTGWVWDPSRPSVSVHVAIWRGAEQIATLPADRFREDLVDAGKGSGYHAFIYTPPPSGDTGPIHVTVLGHDVRLPGGNA